MKQVLVVLMGLLTFTTARAADDIEYDLVICGGTPAAITAAVQASRDNLSVIIVCPDKHLGDLNAGGLGAADSSDKSVIGVLSLEFYKRIGRHYNDNNKAQWTIEPHVTERVFEEMMHNHALGANLSRQDVH